MKVKDSTGSSYVQRDQKVMPFTRGVLFSWNLHNQTDTTTVPSAEVLLYRAADIFDDRFQSLDESQENNADSDLLTIKLGLAQEWMYECKGDGDIDAFHCKHASLMKRVLLKHGTYVYLYKINGSLHLNSDDKVTTLATQRRVHYVDVKQDDEQFSYQDMNNEFCNQQNSHEILTHSDQGNRRAEFFKAYAAVKDMYQVNLSINRVCPLERSIWNQVEKEMAIKFNLNTE